MIAMPGDRGDDDIRAFGRLAGITFDEIVIREDANPRGRKRGEVANLLAAAVGETGFPAEKVTIVHDEFDAAEATIARGERNDLVILLVDRPALVWEKVTSKNATGRDRRR
jgi:cyanophycin synthetase